MLSYDATGAVAAVGAGSAGQILTANASGAPSFQANAGAMKLLAYSQSTTSEATAVADPFTIGTATIPQNHGFSHVLIEADVAGEKNAGDNADWGVYVAGSLVRQLTMAETGSTGGNSDYKDVNPTTLTWVNVGNQSADTEVAIKKVGNSSNYSAVVHGIRIWGLTAPS
jgi:hypothetical protein